MERQILDRAYEIGSARHCALSLDYYSNGTNQIFCQNPNSSEGMLVTGSSCDFISDIPSGFVRFDMYEARHA
jgi:hypothetical protein